MNAMYVAALMLISVTHSIDQQEVHNQLYFGLIG